MNNAASLALCACLGPALLAGAACSIKERTFAETPADAESAPPLDEPTDAGPPAPHIATGGDGGPDGAERGDAEDEVPPFPQTGMLETFDTASDFAPPRWDFVQGFEVRSQQLATAPANGDETGLAIWNKRILALQEVFVTLVSGYNGSEVSLLLHGDGDKVLGRSGCMGHERILAVAFRNDQATVVTCERSVSAGVKATWDEGNGYGVATLRAGSQLGARFRNGAVEVFVDERLIYERAVASTFHTGQRIGLLSLCSTCRFDDFGGGAL